MIYQSIKSIIDLCKSERFSLASYERDPIFPLFRSGKMALASEAQQGHKNPMPWFLYILKCRDESLYTGITTDIPRRIKEHNAKKGAFYTKNKTPVELVYQEAMANQSEARKREAAIKSLTKKQKLELIKNR